MKTSSSQRASAFLMAAALLLLPAVTIADEGLSQPIGLSDSETSYKGVQVLRHNIELFGGEAAPGYYADKEEPGLVSRYSYWQSDTLFFGATNSETGNTVDGVAEFYWFESSVPKSADFYVMVVKVKSAPNAVDDWQLTQENNWLDELMVDIEPCQRLQVVMAEQGQAGSIRWDWSVPFKDYQWEPIKPIEIEEGYSAGFSVGAEANVKAEFKEGGFLADASANINIQTKGYFNPDYSVKSKYSVTLYRWQMLVQGGAKDMKWQMVVIDDWSNDSAYHEYFVVMEAPQGSNVKIDRIDIGGNFHQSVDLWFDNSDPLSVAVSNIGLEPPVTIECYENDMPAVSACPMTLGVCAGATTVCDEGAWVCKMPPKYEDNTELTCDGLDNDCDGAIDEDIFDYCDTFCGEGIKACVDGKWGECDFTPSLEICDNWDNDCNGQIDENLQQPCNNVCGVGILSCVAGKWGACSPAPKGEICDGIDNDCDGQIDNGVSRQCMTACGVGIEVCVAGKWGACSATPKDEICDAIDNDCDGEIDEQFKWGGVGIGAACIGVGKCGLGVVECLPDALGATCSTNPDGSVSEATTEVCDAIDNDCDGLTDADDTDDLLANDTRKCENQTGPCEGATKPASLCVAGVWGACGVANYTAVFAQYGAEICDTFDNDCDGKTDSADAPDLLANDTRKCENQTGPCEGATKPASLCVAGVWGACGVANYTAVFAQHGAEICDGVDNDCDGQVDEGLTRVCNTDCGDGVEECQDGVWSVCSCEAVCEDACPSGEMGCDGAVTWFCTQGATGCLERQTGDDCAEDGKICSEGSCVAGSDPGTRPSPGLCEAHDDCVDGVCLNSTCVPESCFDDVRNGDEMSVDCGGSCPAECAPRTRDEGCQSGAGAPGLGWALGLVLIGAWFWRRRRQA